MTRVNEQNLRVGDAVDFKRRTRHGTIRNVGLCYFFALIYLGYMVLSKESPGSVQYLALVLVFGLISAYAIFRLQRNLDLITDTEFQNAIFSSAVAQQGMFTLVIRPDGSLVYADERFRRWFPALKRETANVLSSLLDAMEIAFSDKERLLQAITTQRSEHVLFNLVDEHGYSHLIRLSCRPLQRPHGLVLLQGREFISARNEREEGENSSSPQEAVKFTNSLLEETTIGMFACSPSGYIRLANKYLEELLGYAPGEILLNKLEYSDLFYDVDKSTTTQEMKAKSGPALLAHKNGSIVKVTLTQKPLYDADSNMIATAALVEAL